MTLVDTYNSITVDTIQRFVVDKRIEDLHLDFKTVKGASLKSDDDKRNLARALSGFANSDGGLIVWGIDARKNSEGIDCASSLKEIAGLKQFTSRLQELTGDSASPRVDGVQHRSIEVVSDRGFAITLVPESDCGPHMAKMGEDRYFKRSGGAFYRMEHFDVADMFGKRRRPLLRLTGSWTFDNSVQCLSITLGLRNDGKGSAIAPYLSFGSLHEFVISRYGVDGSGHEGMSRHRAAVKGFNVYAERTNFAIHPGVHLLVTTLSTGPGFKTEGLRKVSLDFSLCAESYPLRTGTLDVLFSKSLSEA